MRHFGILFAASLAIAMLGGCGTDGSSGPALSVNTSSPPAGTTGVAYARYTFTAAGGTPPFTWTESGPLPPGLTLSASGQLSGMPAMAGTYPISVTATDSSMPPLSASTKVSLQVKDSAIVIAPVGPPAGTVASSYPGFGFSATGGSPPYTWKASGALPPGLTFGSDGTVSGTPTQVGTFAFSVTAQDSATTPETASGSFTISIIPFPFALTELVASAPGTTAVTVDPSLVSPWGIAPAGSALAVVNNGTSTSTQYDGSGNPQPTLDVLTELVIRLPSGSHGTPFQPTGIVANSTSDFVVGSAATAGPAQFIYAGAGGQLAAWAPALGTSPSSPDSSNAVSTYADTAGAIYTGLALANNGSGNFLYAADFHGKKIDVFDAAFKKQTSSAASFSFSDPSLPASYAPFGIQAVDNGGGGATQLYVAYAQPQDGHGKPTTGQSLGLVNVFDTNGTLLQHLVVGGPLNAPWGLALAPTNFGPFGEQLLVGNFGDGKINAFDPVTGQFRGTLSDVKHNVVSVAGLRGIVFRGSALYFVASQANTPEGIYGRIDVAEPLRITIRFVNSCAGSPFPGCKPTWTASINVSGSVPLVEMLIDGQLVRSSITPLPFHVSTGNLQVNSEVSVAVSDVAGEVATVCRRFIQYSSWGAPCAG